MQQKPYFMSNEEWYYFDQNEWRYKLTQNAPPEAVQSYNDFYAGEAEGIDN